MISERAAVTLCPRPGSKLHGCNLDIYSEQTSLSRVSQPRCRQVPLDNCFEILRPSRTSDKVLMGSSTGKLGLIKDQLLWLMFVLPPFLTQIICRQSLVRKKKLYSFSGSEVSGETSIVSLLFAVGGNLQFPLYFSGMFTQSSSRSEVNPLNLSLSR